MRKFVNTSNYFISNIVAAIDNYSDTWTIEISSPTADWVTLPTKGFYWVDVDFSDANKREIFRIISRTENTLTYDRRISPNWKNSHAVWAAIALRDFSQIFDMFSENIDNFGYVEHKSGLTVTIYGWEVFNFDATNNTIATQDFTLTANDAGYIYYDNLQNIFAFNESETAVQQYYVLAYVTTDANTVTGITDKRPMVIPSSWGGWGGWAGWWHTIKFTNQDGEESTLTQRPTMRFKRMNVKDNPSTLETEVEWIWQGTPDLITSDEEIWVDENRQMVVEWSLTVEGTLHNYWKLFIL